MTSEKYITWEEITRGCLALALQASAAVKDAEVVVATADDTVTATIISNLIGLPLVVVNVSPLVIKPHVTPVSISHPILSGAGNAPALPKLVIVSTQNGAGVEIKKLTRTYETRGHEVTSLRLFDYSDSSDQSVYFWQRSDFGTHLIFPWEI